MFDIQGAFRNTLDAALKIFAAKQIFVVDNGGAPTPSDRTHVSRWHPSHLLWPCRSYLALVAPLQEVCASVSRKYYPNNEQTINYLYVPEGNKTHAMYWATEYWIPQLVGGRKMKIIIGTQYLLLLSSVVGDTAGAQCDFPQIHLGSNYR